MTKDIRRHHRWPYVGPIRMSWTTDRGQVKYVLGRCIDFSLSGLRVESPEPIPVRCYVNISAERIQLAGTAGVKHVARHGAKYLLGLELSRPEASLPRAVANSGAATASSLPGSSI